MTPRSNAGPLADRVAPCARIALTSPAAVPSPELAGNAIEERPLKELAAYWGLAAIILVPIGLALIAWLLPGKD